jgi:hypothetical protein
MATSIHGTDVDRDNRWVESDAEEVRQKFNRQSFEVSHHLATHPYLQLPKLMELAERTIKTRPDDLYYDAGAIRVEQRWDNVTKSGFSAIEAMERIENCGAWFIFRSAQRDPEYRVFLDRGLGELKSQIGHDIDSQILAEDIIIFVTSPKRVTPYHMDCECSFLFQIRGTKTVHVFDREDRDVLPEEEIERYWAVDHNAAVYKPHLQHRATSYAMQPGVGIHIPVNCPHWVANDDNVSVSLNVNIQFKDRMRANLYRANYFLRRMGIRPTPPGQSAIIDAVKTYAAPPGVWAATRLMRARHRR